ncbi:hypothetical protein RhiirA1_464682 [Rhizophagus irregularis]|uniref:Uncharacterized protein n=1 Tax=Rhizophagus irregularis TaxID=588596 RepID=A0A2N0RED0_9GLOM|nr:hypothetical protein RhiirA1_466204 [Rhizophagus irregularis]PKC62777.1 hypothetical protein RhiirA1_464682 [Rhizophagus irregularis]
MADKTTIKRGRKKKQQEGPNNEPSVPVTKTPVKRGQKEKQKELTNEPLIISDDDHLSFPEPVNESPNKRGQKKQQKTVIPSSSVNELLYSSDDDLTDENRGNDCNDNVDIRRKDATFQLSLSPVSSPPRTLTSITKNMNTSNIFTPFRDMSNNASGAVNSMPGSIDPELPTPFREMGTIHQLCLWLCANPSVLQFAYSLYLSMQTPVANSSSFVPCVSAPPQLQQEQAQDKTKIGRDFLEELKCLFLRVRDPPKSALEELVRKIVKCDLNSADGIEWLRLANRNFGDFRNKFIDGIERLINSFKERLESDRLPQKEEISAFIDDTVVMNVLQRWLNATKIDELRSKNSLNILRQFIRKAFVVNYVSRDTDATKALDILTQKIAVPSRNGNNFASNLKI